MNVEMNMIWYRFRNRFYCSIRKTWTRK